ncbi:MAG: transpeptidase family protein [Deltaproteobacteria bacterium]|nr:transpeptidase family protein [Deltaproteobacteria bacterium]
MNVRKIKKTDKESATRDYSSQELKLQLRRLLHVGGVVSAVLAFLFYSAFRIQVVQGSKHSNIVKQLSFTKRSLPMERGFILDRKNHPLAVPTELPSAAVDPLKLAYVLTENSTEFNGKLSGSENYEKRKKLALSARLHSQIIDLSNKIALAIHEDPYIISEKLFASIIRGQRFIYLKRQITGEEVQNLKEIGMPRGVLYFPRESSRHYPERQLAAHVLGFTSVDGDGVEGVERYFNIELKGTTSRIRAQKDAKRGIMFINGLPDIQVSGANHVVLTIDSRIQADTEKHLQYGLEYFKAKYGSAIVMDAKTGEILSMANAPLFDPGRRHEIDQRFYRNRAFVDAYELGSVVKPLTMLGALASGRIKADSDIPLDFKVTFRDKAPWTPKDHISISRGSIKPIEIISKSSNKGIAKVAELMGEKSLYSLFVKLGFGMPTGIELPSEPDGKLPPLRLWTSKVYLATHSYGHGITLTLAQLVQAYSVFANEGRIVRPHIVRYVVDDNSEIVSCNSPVSCGNPPKLRRVVSSKSSVKEVVEMMKAVVTGGTGQKADLRKWGYSAAGKTGTAEKVEKGLAYSQNHNRVTFVGLVPADNPRVVIAVMYDDPEGDPETARPDDAKSELRKDAGYVAAPIFAKIARSVMYRLGVAPDLQISIKKDGKSVKSELPVTKPYFPPLPAPEKIVMPDFAGKTLGESMDLLSELGVKCRIRGNGVVISQNPPPGGPFNNCQLKLSVHPDDRDSKDDEPGETENNSKRKQ